MRTIDTVLASLVGLALVAALVSSHGQTSSAIADAMGALKTAIGKIMQPVGGH